MLLHVGFGFIGGLWSADKWGFGIAMLPVGALYIYYQAHIGRISSTRYCTVFQSLVRHASVRRILSSRYLLASYLPRQIPLSLETFSALINGCVFWYRDGFFCGIEVV